MNIIDTKGKKGYNPKERFKVVETKPLTNYDRLISKTPEELDGWLTEKMHCIDCPQEEKCMLYGRSMNCKSMWLEWLKAPVEVQK